MNLAVNVLDLVALISGVIHSLEDALDGVCTAPNPNVSYPLHPVSTEIILAFQQYSLTTYSKYKCCTFMYDHKKADWAFHSSPWVRYAFEQLIQFVQLEMIKKFHPVFYIAVNKFFGHVVCCSINYDSFLFQYAIRCCPIKGRTIKDVCKNSHSPPLSILGRP